MEEKKQDEKIESVLAEAEEAESNVENARALEEEMPETAARRKPYSMRRTKKSRSIKT